MRKKLLGLVMAAAMTAAMLTGCGNSGSGDNANPETSADTQISAEDTEEAKESGISEAAGKTVGMTVPSVGNDFMLALTNACKEAIDATGATMQVDSADGDVTTQIEQIENYISMGVDVIVAFPINGESLTTVCQKAMNEGIPVFAFAMEIPDGATTSMISAQESDMGAACAQMASEWIDANFADAGDGEVNVYLIGSTYSPESVDRTDAMATLADMNSKVTIYREDSTDWNSSDQARSMAENRFLVDSDIDVVIAVNATTALGVDSYMTSSDCPVDDLDHFAIFTVDETDEVDAKIQSSDNNESLIRGTVSMGAISDTVNDFMQGMTPLLNGDTPIERINGSTTCITADYFK